MEKTNESKLKNTLNRKSRTRANMKFALGCISLVGGFAGFLFGVNYLGNRLFTGSWNVQQQKTIRENRRKETEAEKVSYEADWYKLFGPNGYVDINHDGILSFQEKVVAWQQMGYSNRLYDPAYDQGIGSYDPFAQFPRPTNSRILERAVNYYESRMKGGR